MLHIHVHVYTMYNVHVHVCIVHPLHNQQYSTAVFAQREKTVITTVSLQFHSPPCKLNINNNKTAGFIHKSTQVHVHTHTVHTVHEFVRVRVWFTVSRPTDDINAVLIPSRSLAPHREYTLHVRVLTGRSWAVHGCSESHKDVGRTSSLKHKPSR